MDYSPIIVLLGIPFAVHLFGRLATFTGILLYFTIIFFGYWPIIVVIGLISVPILGMFYKLRKSPTGAMTVYLSLWFVGVNWVLSRLSEVAYLSGRLIPISQIFEWFLHLYLSRDFIENTRENVVQRGADYIERGEVDVEMDRSGKELVQEAQAHADRAGIPLSNGEMIIGVAFAMISIRTPPFAWANPPTWVGVVLSVTLVVVVMLRSTAVDALLYRSPSVDEGVARLYAIRAWNSQVASGLSAWYKLTQIRGMTEISEEAYYFYLDWVLRERIMGSGVTKYSVLRLRKPIISFIIAEVDDITPSEASLQLFDQDVFTSPEFAALGYADKTSNDTEDTAELRSGVADLN
ncbi:hypothetical protein [Halorarum salinum]|uniref:Uncharacterized protein n=1 Tax=Halorarum salinum TaxID=2743089 RepID=A0A7D5QI28_9EURY|nr:hypothetical protein [Halobaculum salinum]QLG62644.1 hypothetical protein HUG12_13285 [Halobaculum salinum]